MIVSIPLKASNSTDTRAICGEHALIAMAVGRILLGIMSLAAPRAFAKAFGVSHIRDGRVTVVPGAGGKPSDVIIRATATVIAAIAGGRITLTDAITQDHLHATGDQTALTALLAVIER